MVVYSIIRDTVTKQVARKHRSAHQYIRKFRYGRTSVRRSENQALLSNSYESWVTVFCSMDLYVMIETTLAKHILYLAMNIPMLDRLHTVERDGFRGDCNVLINGQGLSRPQ